MIISNVALLIACTVFYQLVLEDFGKERADRTILYLSLFPSAFFLLAAYSESLFLCLAALCFYHMRRGHWWLAGLFGLLGSLTRSVGIMMVFPFFFEYLRQHQFKLRPLLRLDILSNALIPAGLGLYCLYCYKKFGDFLAFAHHENIWGRSIHMPWDGFIQVLRVLRHAQEGLLSFFVLHNLLAVSIDLFILLIIILIVIGPWRLPRAHWSYSIYAVMAYLFFHMATSNANLPLESMVRYLLAIFPAFIMLAGLGKHPIFHRGYLIISSGLLFFCALLFLTGRWMT
jgi:Gpi18-like mannosyltransferase